MTQLTIQLINDYYLLIKIYFVNYQRSNMFLSSMQEITVLNASKHALLFRGIDERKLDNHWCLYI